jgi:hypothetical protein
MTKQQFKYIYKYHNIKNADFGAYIEMHADTVSHILNNDDSLRGDWVSNLRRFLYEIRDVKIDLHDPKEVEEYMEYIKSTGFVLKPYRRSSSKFKC